MQVVKSEVLPEEKTITCIHDNDDKKSIRIRYNGKIKNLIACPECVDVIIQSKFCEVIESDV